METIKPETNCSEFPNNSDTISRQAAIDAFLTELTKRERKNLLHTWSTVEVKYFITDMMEQLPSAQPELHYDEWCTDCKEYDQERHCCPRFNRVIRGTVEEYKAEHPEPCDDPRADVYYLAEKIGIHRLYALVVELRGEPELCEDAVSREAAIKCCTFGGTSLGLIDELRRLPSAQPENTNCIYCHEDSDGYIKPIEKNCHAFICFGMNGWELSLKANGWHGSAKIQYCPMCGRRLADG